MSKRIVITEQQAKRLIENGFVVAGTNPHKQNMGYMQTGVSASLKGDGEDKPSEPTTLDKIQKTKSQRSSNLRTFFGIGLGAFGLW